MKKRTFYIFLFHIHFVSFLLSKLYPPSILLSRIFFFSLFLFPSFHFIFPISTIPQISFHPKSKQSQKSNLFKIIDRSTPLENLPLSPLRLKMVLDLFAVSFLKSLFFCRRYRSPEFLLIPPIPQIFLYAAPCHPLTY